MCFFFNDTATTEIYTLSLHDALPILRLLHPVMPFATEEMNRILGRKEMLVRVSFPSFDPALEDAEADQMLERTRLARSEEHTSELQSRQYLVCRLLLEKKKTHIASGI